MTKLTIEEWNDYDALQCMDALQHLPHTIFLDSNRSSHPLNRYSFIGWKPVETLSIKNNVVQQNGKIIPDVNFFDFLKERIQSYNFGTFDISLPFYGGLMGYFSYDIGRQFENIKTITQDDQDIPDAILGIYTNLLVFDHNQNKSWLIYETKEQKKFLLSCLEDKSEIHHTNDNIQWTEDQSDDEYCHHVTKAIDHIYAGDVYQVNITRRFETTKPASFHPFGHYKKLRAINPAPFAAYMNFGDIQISSCSPERFIELREGILDTRPIKGTMPSNQDPDLLSNDPKERAENTMIVDLLRNDISKVCEPHSVTVPSLCNIETFEGLHHMVSTIRGKLKSDMTAIDVLKSCLPGGSITGAPKISAMNIIENLEPFRRNIYCGSLGYIGFNGNMDTNIAIRTLVYTNDKIYLNVGSGIVSDSIPEKELQETYNKAQKIFESFGT